MEADSEDSSTIAASTPSPGQPGFYPWYATGVLMSAYVLSYLDRQILYLMVGPIRRDLHITDFQFSLLTGAAFGIFYTLMGMPIAWLADSSNRKNLIAAGIAAWSIMTALCGLAQSYGLLFLARIGVGVGEATLSPAAYSYLSDSFDRLRLPRAVSVYALGLFIGAGMALIIGGEVIGALEDMPPVMLPIFGQISSWHLVFLTIGLPGLLVALWVSTLREPKRTGAVESASKNDGLPFSRAAKFVMHMPLASIPSLSEQGCFRLWPMPTPGIPRFSCGFGAGRFRAQDRSRALHR